MAERSPVIAVSSWQNAYIMHLASTSSTAGESRTGATAKVFLLGGAGQYGLAIGRLLVGQDFVSELIIAGRDLEKAKLAAANLGRKAVPLQVDASDEGRLASLLSGSDILVNAAGWDTVMPALRAAIRAGAHYCDIDAPQQAFDLDGEARAAGITAGIQGGLVSNLMIMHAASQLDEVLEVHLGTAWIRPPRLARAFASREDWRETVAALRESDLVRWWLWFRWSNRQRYDDPNRRMINTYSNGKWVAVDPLVSGVEIPREHGAAVTAFPISAIEDELVRPQYLKDVRQVCLHFSRFPPPLSELLETQAKRLVEGKADGPQASGAFYEAVERDPERWLAGEDAFLTFPDVPAWWVNVIGHKAGAPARYACWITPDSRVDDREYVSVPGAVAAMMIIQGEARGPGVLPPEGCFEPAPFFERAARLLPETPPGGKLLGETFEWLR